MEPESKAHKNTLRKVIIAVAIIAAVGVGSVFAYQGMKDAAGEASNSLDDGIIPTTTESVITSQKPIESLIPSLNPTPEPTLAPATVIIETDAGNFTINNETKKIYDEEGEEVGYIVEGTTLNGKEIEAMALNSEKVLKIIEKRISEGNESVIPIPVDPKDGQKISIECKDLYTIDGKVYNFNNIIIKTNKSIDLTNFYYNHEKLMVGITNSFSFNGKSETKFTAIDTEDDSLKKVKDGDIFGKLGIYGIFSDVYMDFSNGNQSHKFGTKLASFSGDIFIGVGPKLSNLMKIGDSYVYLKTNISPVK